MKYLIIPPPEPPPAATLQEAVNRVREPWETAQLYNILTKLKPGEQIFDINSGQLIIALED